MQVVRQLKDQLRGGSPLEVDVGERLPVGVADVRLLGVEFTAPVLKASVTADPPARAAAGIALTTNVVFKFIDNEFLFRNYGLEQIANGDNADHLFAF